MEGTPRIVESVEVNALKGGFFMWHDILEWLPTIINIIRSITAVISLSISVRRLRRRLTER
ncbi:hypothetical protein ACIA47_06840 [Micromonospora sp. NPDC051227]|uniref:hypothetical protein n=1 Tax=Micromonospora sp. NPDC051227 TaxID=3364285 RepID=UPI00379A4D62